MQSSSHLRKELEKINHKSYPFYKDIKGSYDFGSYILNIEHVQSDPFASPSDLSIHITAPGFPAKYYEKKENRIALQDQILRLFTEGIRRYAQGKGGKKKGSLKISRPTQKVMERSAVTVNPETGELTVRFHAAFPAAGRKILSHELIRILFDELPEVVRHSLLYEDLSSASKDSLQKAYELSCDQQKIRDELESRKLSAFIANGSILPRKSGQSDQPMEDAVAFASPASMEVELDLPYRGKVKGLGIPEGITLIAGGGYHGKSTLLNALEEGIYNHISEDGRELAITRSDAAKIRAEDGRSVHQEDISMFIRNLPTRKDTGCFTSEDASGSTSQAANVMEAIESGSRLLLIDEDTSATNFMVRDDLMASVIAPEDEPIIPFISRIRPLFDHKGVSTILVAGSSGAFFDKADHVIQMDEYEPVDITEKAKAAAAAVPSVKNIRDEAIESDHDMVRIPEVNENYRQDRVKVKVNGLDTVTIAREPVDVRYMEQLVDSEQLHTLGKMAVLAARSVENEGMDLKSAAEKTVDLVEQKGYRVLGRGDYAAVRPQDLMGLINRTRSQQFRQKKD